MFRLVKLEAGRVLHSARYPFGDPVSGNVASLFFGRQVTGDSPNVKSRARLYDLVLSDDYLTALASVKAHPVQGACQAVLHPLLGNN